MFLDLLLCELDCLPLDLPAPRSHPPLRCFLADRWPKGKEAPWRGDPQDEDGHTFCRRDGIPCTSTAAGPGPYDASLCFLG
jgi:hypothetical protein